MEFSYTKTKKNCVLYNGYVFNLHRAGETKNIWRCSQHTLNRCYARLHISNDVIVHKLPDPFIHTHAANASNVGARNVMNDIITQAKNSVSGSSQNIIAHAVNNISVAVAVSLPLPRSIARTIRHHR